MKAFLRSSLQTTDQKTMAKNVFCPVCSKFTEKSLSMMHSYRPRIHLYLWSKPQQCLGTEQRQIFNLKQTQVAGGPKILVETN